MKAFKIRSDRIILHKLPKSNSANLKLDKIKSLKKPNIGKNIVKWTQ
jgi:hypothetical protein